MGRGIWCRIREGGREGGREDKVSIWMSQEREKQGQGQQMN
jgi:hypothetical protein